MPRIAASQGEETAENEKPWEDYDRSPHMCDAGPFINIKVISPELIATIDLIVMMAAQPSCNTIRSQIKEYEKRRDWYRRPEVKAKFDASFKKIAW
jgi:hypothetical protein